MDAETHSCCREYVAGLELTQKQPKLAACVQAIDRFRQEPETVVLLASMLASGTGITVTCASEVVLMEPYWNPFVSADLCCCACAVLCRAALFGA